MRKKTRSPKTNTAKRISPNKLKNYTELRYNPIIEQAEDEGQTYFLARIPELIGLLATGDTLEEVKADIEEAKADYIKALMKMNIPVPLPKPSNVKIFTFVTGTAPNKAELAQLVEPIQMHFDLSKVQQNIGFQPKELSPGIFLEYATPESKIQFGNTFSEFSHSGTKTTTTVEQRM